MSKEIEEMTVYQFIERLLDWQKEIGDVDGSKIASHNLKSAVRVTIKTKSNETVYGRIVALDIDQLPGCGCWNGIHIICQEN